jgi:negative regulator of sigma E activity
MRLDNSQSKSFEESLSALMDNETDDLELRRLLRELPDDASLTGTWKRFHEARSILHSEEMHSLSSSACNRIFDAIAAEPAYAGKQPPVAVDAGVAVKSAWWESAGRVAIAASVALAAFVGLQSILLDSVPEQSLADQEFNSVSEEHTSNGIVALEDAGRFDAQAQQRLDDYIRSVSIQYRDEAAGVPQFNILQDSQLIRHVNQIDN